MTFQTPELMVIGCVILVVLFVIVRAQHYFGSRRDENHDSYLTVTEECVNNKKVYKKCPRLEMWGFKMSATLLLLGLNMIVVLYIAYKLYKSSVITINS